MQRYEVLDGFRGFFLLFMLVNHLNFTGGSLLAKVNHAELGYVQDAQGFIFISGLIVGLYYLRGYRKGQGAEMDRKLLARAGLLLRYSLALLAGIALVALLFRATEVGWGNYFPELYSAPKVMLASAAALLYQPTYLDILPQYILYLLVSPLLIRLVLRGHGLAVAAGSLLLWLAVQFGLHLPLIAGVEALGQSLHPAFTLRAGFNPLAWQILFVGGLLIGCWLRDGRFEPADWFGPARRGLFTVALGFVLVFMAYRLSNTFGVVPEVLAERFAALDSRLEFSLVYLVNFLALGYVVTWLLIGGPASGSRLLRAVAALLRGLFNARFLRFIGQHSLQVYAYHILVVYAVVLVDRFHGPFSEGTKALITLAGVASLALPAWLHANRQRLRLQPLAWRSAA